MIKNISNLNSFNENYIAFNWGIDILSETESFECFAAKFCYLNQMTAKKFFKFWLNLYENERTFNIFFNNISLNDKEILKSYSNFLYKRHDCIEREIIIEKNHDCHSKIFSYCESCIKSGFHSELFNKNWMVICPVHRIKLKKENLIVRKNLSKNDIFSLRVQKIIELSVMENPSWPRNKHKFLTSYFCKIRDWLIGLEENINCYSLITGNIIHTVNENNLKNLISFLNYISPIPNELLFLFPYFRKTKARVKIYDNEEILFFLIQYKDQINNILEFYKNKLQLNKFNNFKIFNLVNHYLEYNKIIHLKNKRKCKWAERKREYRWVSDGSQFHNNIWTVCQYEYASHLMCSNWLDFNLLGRNEIKRIIKLESTYKNLKISRPIKEFIEDILLEILINTVIGLDKRIKAIDNFYSVDIRELFASNIYLKLEDKKCLLINTLGTSERITNLLYFQLQV